MSWLVALNAGGRFLAAIFAVVFVVWVGAKGCVLVATRDVLVRGPKFAFAVVGYFASALGISERRCAQAWGEGRPRRASLRALAAGLAETSERTSRWTCEHWTVIDLVL